MNFIQTLIQTCTLLITFSNWCHRMLSWCKRCSSDHSKRISRRDIPFAKVSIQLSNSMFYVCIMKWSFVWISWDRFPQLCNSLLPLSIGERVECINWVWKSLICEGVVSECWSTSSIEQVCWLCCAFRRYSHSRNDVDVDDDFSFRITCIVCFASSLPFILPTAGKCKATQTSERKKNLAILSLLYNLHSGLNFYCYSMLVHSIPFNESECCVV